MSAAIETATATALEERRRRAAAAWGGQPDLVLIGSGDPISIAGCGDQVYEFMAHPEYVYLTDDVEPGALLAFDPQSGWQHFVPPVTQAERVWEGLTQRAGTPLTELAGWLAARRGRPIVTLGARLPGVASDVTRTVESRRALAQVRRAKDAIEVERMRHAARATAVGYAAARPHIRTGNTERAIAIELEAGFRRGGGDRVAYGTIVGAGSNAAVLHFMPTARTLSANDVVLIDAGAEVRRYCADVTRTYPAGGAFEGFARDLFELVHAVERETLARCVVGSRWRDIHLAAALQILDGLARLGIVKGTADALLEQGVHTLFFPHGIGHMVGLGVRDVGPDLPRLAVQAPPHLMVRIDLTLEPGDTVTVEPGIYFIPALLDDTDKRREYVDAVHWSRVDALRSFGGIRIEDNVHVTAAGPEVLTEMIPVL
ncbi:MAG: aminopeptidase P family protein [Candidatus Eisenbacteria bacterium]|uniref:Xaa-Pro aminopeptidase n=1 Tax=Eiseniibacteriota bacterium TaxID=2212470 RepID=A0A849SD27_UNCEI|nr:aminopeptidase P family protein [Candidatus Eisenbacteria bacterium]